MKVKCRKLTKAEMLAESLAALAAQDRLMAQWEASRSRSSVGSEHRTSNSAVAGSSPAGNANQPSNWRADRMFAMNNDTSESWPMSLTDARRILEGKAGPVSTKEAAKTILKEMDRLNGVINTQARCIADVRKALR